MKKFSFHVGDYSPSAEFLFNTKKHILLQLPEGWKCAYVLDEKDKCHGFIWVHIHEALARSPVRAPFGGIEISSTLPPEIAYQLITFAEQFLRQSGVHTIHLTVPPLTYNGQSGAFITAFLLNHGFQITLAEVSSIIPVSASSFESIISSWELRKLKQARKAGLSFQSLKLKNLHTVYRFLAACRQQKGYELSMDYAALEQLALSFPKDIKLFSVQQDHQWAAACVAVQVSKKIIYTFYYDHAHQFQQVSPIVMLMEGIYKICKRQNIKLIDLGTSTSNAQPNFKLLEFKRQLGALPSMKLSFGKNLHL